MTDMPNPSIWKAKSVTFRDEDISKVFLMASEWLKENPVYYTACDTVHTTDETGEIHFLILYVEQP